MAESLTTFTMDPMDEGSNSDWDEDDDHCQSIVLLVNKVRQMETQLNRVELDVAKTKSELDRANKRLKHLEGNSNFSVTSNSQSYNYSYNMYLLSMCVPGLTIQASYL